MSKMRLADYIPFLKKAKPRRLQKVQRIKVSPKGDTKLEAKHRRHGRWRSIRTYRKNTWDANNVSRGVEGVLQSAERSSQDQRVREKETRRIERVTSLNRLYQNKDFQYLWKILQKWEAMAYEDLTKPELRKEGTSLDHYIGFMIGRIGAFNDIKDLVIKATITNAKFTNKLQ